MQTRDAFGNPVLTHRENNTFAWTASATLAACPVAGCAQGSAVGLKVEGVNATAVVYAGRGRYQVFLAPTVAGQYTVDLTFNGQTLQSAPWNLTVTPASSYGPNCVVAGAAAYTGHVDSNNTFSIRARDRFYNWRESGGDAFDWQLQVSALLHPQ